MPVYPTRKLTILALDPSVRDDGKLLRTQVETPNEQLRTGPRSSGYVYAFISNRSTLSAARPRNWLRFAN